MSTFNLKVDKGDMLLRLLIQLKKITTEFNYKHEILNTQGISRRDGLGLSKGGRKVGRMNV